MEPLGQVAVHIAQQREISRLNLRRGNRHLIRFPRLFIIGEVDLNCFVFLGRDHVVGRDGIIQQIDRLIFSGIESQGRARHTQYRPGRHAGRTGTQIAILAFERRELGLPLLFVEV